MIEPESKLSDEPPVQQRKRPWLREAMFLGGVYFVAVIVGSSFISFCGPGCGFGFWTVITIVSGFLMLRQPLVPRCICLAVLLIGIGSMMQEMGTRDSWQVAALKKQVSSLREQLKQTDGNQSPPAR